MGASRRYVPCGPFLALPNESFTSRADMNPRQLVEVISAVHLAHYVEGSLEQRGGLMLVAPPGALKSTLTETAQHYPDALVLTDVNVSYLADLRDAMTGGNITSLVFSEFAKLYERNPQTAMNIEGTLRALASEGFSAASFQDHRINRRKAFASIIAVMTPATQEKHFKRWEESGFNRRFLWASYGVRGAYILDEAASGLQRLDFGVRDIIRVPPLGQTIPFMLTDSEKLRVRSYVAHQPGGSHTQQIQLLARVWSVLKWWHIQNGTAEQTEETIDAFAKTLSRDGSDLVLTVSPPKVLAARRKKQ
jgi:hypothetical protein